MYETVFFYLLFISLSNFQSQAFSPHLQVHRTFMPKKINRLLDIQTVSDVQNVVTGPAFVQDTLSYTIDGFKNGFQSRVIGLLIGNILAGAAIKIIADIFQNIVRSREQIKQPEPLPPSPAPVSAKSWSVLALCVFIDIIGDSSYSIPGVGELEDVVWAPISAFALNQIFGSTAVTSLDFIKEILPGLDVIPVASLAWLLQNFYPTSPLTKILGIAPPIPAISTSNSPSTTTTITDLSTSTPVVTSSELEEFDKKLSASSSNADKRR